MEALAHPSPLVEGINALVAPFGLHIPDYLVFCALITLIVGVVGVTVRSRLSVDNPGKLQIFLEDLTTFIVAQLENAIGEGKGRKFIALCGGVFVFILLGNLMGQIPGLGAPTGNVNVPFGCAITVWLYYHWQGIKAQGIGSYLLHFAFPPGIPKALAPLMLPIELISHIARPLSLTLRRMGNMIADHKVVFSFFTLVPWFVPLPFYLLGLLVCLVQAIVFCTLTMVYLGMAVEHEEH